jgi:hypothetical protein
MTRQRAGRYRCEASTVQEAALRQRLGGAQSHGMPGTAEPGDQGIHEIFHIPRPGQKWKGQQNARRGSWGNYCGRGRPQDTYPQAPPTETHSSSHIIPGLCSRIHRKSFHLLCLWVKRTEHWARDHHHHYHHQLYHHHHHHHYHHQLYHHHHHHIIISVNTIIATTTITINTPISTIRPHHLSFPLSSPTTIFSSSPYHLYHYCSLNLECPQRPMYKAWSPAHGTTGIR